MSAHPLHLNSAARLDLMFGPMFCGKTTAILRKLSQLTDLGLQALYINHARDNRADTTVFSTHSQLLQNNSAISKNITTIKLSNLSNANFEKIDLKSFDVIGIDEAQFFGRDLIPFVINLVDNMKKYVIVVGLDGNFRRERFGNILDLVPLADNVVKLHAFCKHCASSEKILRPALFSLYTAASTPTTTDIIVGGPEKFEPVCRACYLAKQK